MMGTDIYGGDLTMHCQEKWQNYITGQIEDCEELVEPGEDFCRDHLPENDGTPDDYDDQWNWRHEH